MVAVTVILILIEVKKRFIGLEKFLSVFKGTVQTTMKMKANKRAISNLF